ncbi:hypothetical protein AB0L99_44575 [Streptomyces sp. NPDC051954]
MIARELRGQEKAEWWKLTDAAYPDFVDYRPRPTGRSLSSTWSPSPTRG